jgi:hypothetical protein
MMLQALIAYADREKLGDPDFGKMPVRWEIALDVAGKLTGVVIPRVKDPDAKKKQPRQVVRPFTRNDDIGHGKAHFLCDTPERALGMLPENVKPSTVVSRATQFAYFKSLLRGLQTSAPKRNPHLKLIVFKHQSALGNSPAHQLFDRVVVKLKDKVKAEKRAPRSFADDYDVTINRDGLSKPVELIELL